MNFFEALADLFANTSTGKNKFRIYKGKTGHYGKLGGKEKRGETLWYKKKK